MENDSIVMNACAIVENIAFEVISNMESKKILASDFDNPSYKASFVVRGREFYV